MSIKERLNGNFGWVVGIIVQLPTIAVMWGAMGQRVTALEKVTEAAACQISKIDGIERDYGWIKDSLSEIKSDVKELKRR